MKITSTAFEDNGVIPQKYTCDGEDINPPLKIEDVPEEAKSLVLVLVDPDVPESIRADGIWNHWVVFNIPPDVTEIPEGEEPEGKHGIGTSGNREYHGPCPPDGEHRYFFKLYALKTELELEDGCSKEELDKTIGQNVIEATHLMGRYSREQ